MVLQGYIAGVMLVAMGLLKMGAVIKFIPFPVIVGLNSGIAVNIFSSQIKDLFGLQTEALPVDFIHKWLLYFKHLDTINPASLGVGVLSILIIALAPKVLKKIPSFLFTIILITGLVYLLRTYWGVTGIQTIADRFVIDASLPSVQTPDISFDTVRMLLPTAFTIAMLGAIVSLLSATVADGVTGDKHDSNTELIAQGVANMITPFFGGIPATGAIARTMTNINSGGRTPIAGIVHAVILLVVLLFLGSFTQHIPMACLAGVLVVVAYNLSDWRTFRNLLRNPKADVAVLLSTFSLTVIFDLTIAIEIGLLLAVVLFIRRVSETSTVSVFTDVVSTSVYSENGAVEEKLIIPDGVEIYEIEGPFFFGVASKFEEIMKQIGDKPQVRIVRMRKVPFIDSTGCHNLESFLKMSQKDGTQVLLSGVNEQVRSVLIQTGIEAELGKENVLSNIYDAMARAKEIVK